MSKRPALSRPQKARATRARRKAVRKTLGRLRDRVLRGKTVVRYRVHVHQFFVWHRASGRVLPAAVLEFDSQLCAYAETLWEEGDGKSVLGNTLSGLAHFVPGLRGHQAGSWRLYKAWAKAEPGDRAPPFTVAMTQAISGVMLSKGYPRAAWCTMLAFHCVLRTGEFLELRSTDTEVLPRSIQLRLRETKIGGRLNITEDVLVLDKWLVSVTRRLLATVFKGDVLVGMSARAYRSLWRECADTLKLPLACQPYGLRRGGATAFFQACGSRSRTADRGRWASERAMKTYVTTALQEMAAQEFDESPLVRSYRQKRASL